MTALNGYTDKGRSVSDLKTDDKERVLVIPDIHLKPWIIEKADDIMKAESLKKAVFLGDIADDWDKQGDIGLYNETYRMVMEFTEKYQEALFCYGNHDISYIWKKLETGYSYYAETVVMGWIMEMRKKLGQRMAFVHRIGQTVFSHAGITERFVNRYFHEEQIDDVDDIISAINFMGSNELWKDDSPLWARPDSMYYTTFSKEYLQICGHTPVKKPELKDSKILIADLFSTYSDGKTPIGNQKFILADPNEQTWETV